MKLAVCQLCLNIAAGCLLSSFCLPSQERRDGAPTWSRHDRRAAAPTEFSRFCGEILHYGWKYELFWPWGIPIRQVCLRSVPGRRLWLAGCSRGRVGWTNHSCGRQCHNSNRYFRSNFVIMLIFARQHSALQLCLLSCNVSSSCRPARPSRCCAMSTF